MAKHYEVTAKTCRICLKTEGRQTIYDKIGGKTILEIMLTFTSIPTITHEENAYFPYTLCDKCFIQMQKAHKIQQKIEKSDATIRSLFLINSHSNMDKIKVQTPEKYSDGVKRSILQSRRNATKKYNIMGLKACLSPISLNREQHLNFDNVTLKTQNSNTKCTQAIKRLDIDKIIQNIISNERINKGPRVFLRKMKIFDLNNTATETNKLPSTEDAVQNQNSMMLENLKLQEKATSMDVDKEMQISTNTLRSSVNEVDNAILLLKHNEFDSTTECGNSTEILQVSDDFLNFDEQTQIFTNNLPSFQIDGINTILQGKYTNSIEVESVPQGHSEFDNSDLNPLDYLQIDTSEAISNEPNNDFLSIEFLEKKVKHHACTKCNKGFNSTSKLKRHIKIHEDIVCESCGKVCRSATLKKHLYSEHSVSLKFQCKLCDIELIDKEGLMEHRITDHKESARCEICHKVVFTRHLLKKHMKIHEKIYKCTVCEKVFRNGETLKSHKDFHNGIKFKCDKCDKEFDTKYKKRYHIKLVHA